MKDKKWAQREVDRYLSYEGVDAARNALVFVKSVINQLDEPEVLSQDWIDEHTTTYADLRGGTHPFIGLEDLRNLIIPKQELPVMPSYMAEYLELAKSDVSLMRVLEIANRRDELPKWEKEYDWISTNDEVFARAWLDGYTVAEEEPLYRARLKVITVECAESYLRTQSSNTEDRLEALEIGCRYVLEDLRHLSEFTEHELKVLDIWGSDQWEVEGVEDLTDEEMADELY